LQEGTPWKLDTVRACIAHHKGLNSDQKDDLLGCVQSLARYEDIFLYHYFFIKEELEKHFDAKVGMQQTMRFILPPQNERIQANYTKLAILANFIGCVHTARNLFDIFSRLINFLVLKSSRITNDRQRNIATVTQRLPESDLKSVLAELLNSDSYKYVSSLSNFLKHTSHVPYSFPLHADFRPEVQGFKYDQKEFPPKKLMQALEEMLEVKNALVKCGIELDKTLGKISLEENSVSKT
jgi:hypothetical protein